MKWALTSYGLLLSAILVIIIAQLSCKKAAVKNQQVTGTYVGVDSIFILTTLDTIIHDTAVVTAGSNENSIITVFKATGVTLDDTIIGNNWEALNGLQNPLGGPGGQGSFNGNVLTANYYYFGKNSQSYSAIFYGTLQ